MIKKDDLVYCIRNYEGFEVGKNYSVDYVGEECDISITLIRPSITSHVYFCRFKNKTCVHRVKSEDEWKLDRCQLRLDYWNKKTKEYIESYGNIVTSCTGSASHFFDYFITMSESRKLKLEKIIKHDY